MTMNAANLSKNIYELGCALNAAPQGRPQTDEVTDQILEAIDRAQGRIAEILRFAGVNPETSPAESASIDHDRVLRRMANGPDGSVKARTGFTCAACDADVDEGDPCFPDSEAGDVCADCGEVNS